MQAALSKESLLRTRKRLLEDFEFYCKHCVQIRTKEGTIVPLILNEVQRRFVKRIAAQTAANGRLRFIVLKARQQGLSTVISAWQYFWVSQRKAQKGLVMAHEADSTTTLFDMYKRIHDNMPAPMRQETRYASRGEVIFKDLDSGLRVATAGGRGVARGETLQVIHLSEVAFWPTKFAQSNFNGLVQAVPDLPGTAKFIESTANGMTGLFRQTWVKATSGENEYEPFFSAWFESDEYRKPAPKGFSRTPDEQKVAAKFGLDDDQLYWRRQKIGENGLEMFRQEYPSTPDEAFISTGRPVFNPDYIVERLRDTKAPVERLAVENGVLNPHPLGELSVYHNLDPKETYVIGADVGMGVRNGDYSVAQVLDSKLRQVAVWRGLVHPDYFADILVSLGFYYNGATIAPERNNHGILTCARLRDKDYPYIWTDIPEGSLEERDSVQIGFFTSEKSKPLIIDKLRGAERKREIEINCPVTLTEMQTFVCTESGKMQAEDGAHDDCVMALAIANHVHEGRCEPVTFGEEFYSVAV